MRSMCCSPDCRRRSVAVSTLRCTIVSRRDVDRPLWRLLGVDPAAPPLTSFTVGIAPLDEMLAKVREIGTHPVLKVKLGAGAEIDTMAAIRSIYGGTIRIDANEGWTPEAAVTILRELERFEIEFCEQPIPAGAPERLRWIRERTSIPIVTDEDSKDADDLLALAGCVDGINVKLVKCGGIRGALAMIHTARALGLKVMLGCMVESAILSTAAAHLSPLVDWADLDGPFLVARDPFDGMRYAGGKIVLPDARDSAWSRKRWRHDGCHPEPGRGTALRRLRAGRVRQA